MKNRLIALLLFILGIIFAIGLFFYYFIFRVSHLTINIENFEEVKNYNLETFHKNSQIKKIYTCEKNPCEIPDLISGDYNVTLYKEGYENLISGFKLKVGEKKSITQKFTKKLVLKEVKDIFSIKKTKLSPEEEKEEKIKLLKNKKNYNQSLEVLPGIHIYEYENFGEKEIFYEENNIFSLKNDENFNEIKMLKSINSDEIIFQLPKRFILWNNKEIFYFDFGIQINYFKKGEKNFVIKTEKGSFEILENNKINYFYPFYDYTDYIDNAIIGILREEDKERKANFGLEEINNFAIIYFNQKTLEKKVVYQTSENIEQIFLYENKIYIKIKGKYYIVENI